MKRFLKPILAMPKSRARQMSVIERDSAILWLERSGASQSHKMGILDTNSAGFTIAIDRFQSPLSFVLARRFLSGLNLLD